MVATFVWPWKNDDELLEVRNLFYPDAHLDQTAKREKQQLAVNIVSQVTSYDYAPWDSGSRSTQVPLD